MSESPERRALRLGKEYWNSWRKKQEEAGYYHGDAIDRYVGDVVISFQGVRLSGQNLSGYNLSNVRMDNAHIRKANLSETILFDSSLCGIDFEGSDLTNCDLSYTDLTGANFRNARLVNADLTWAVLRDSKLTNADLTGACLSSAILERADIENAIFDEVKLTTQDDEDPALGQFLELSTCKNLETVRIKDSQIIIDYLAEAFEYVHTPYLIVSEECPNFFNDALKKITALNKLSNYGIPPTGLIDVAKCISEELIKYLKSHPKALYEIRPRQFEELIAEIFKSFGWEVELTPETRDGGYDLFAICKDISGLKSKWIIECKKYAENRKVGVDIIRSLYGVKKTQHGANALLATTSFFSNEAVKYKSSRYDLQLRDFDGVMEWIKNYKAAPGKQIVTRERTIIT